MNSTSNYSDICKCAGVDYILYSTMVSIILAKDLSTYEQSLLGNFIQSVGQNLTLFAAARNKCELVSKVKSESDNYV